MLDGSVMPGPTGPNPSLTIAAFADRAIEHQLETPTPRRAAAPVRTPRQRTPPMDAAAPADPNVTTVRFTEQMKGYLRSPGAIT